MSIAMALQAVGSIVQGVGGFVASRQNANAMEAQGQEEQRAALAQETDLRVQARAAIGEQIASQFSGGFEGGTGSALDAVRESQINAALDVLRIRREGVVKATTLRKQASAAVQGGKSDWAAARSGTSGG